MKKSILLILLMALLAPWTGLKADELTVHDGTVESSNTPMYVGYFDDFTRSQVVFPASELEEMAGGTITSLKWYTKSSNIPYTTVSSVDIYLKEVSSTSISAFEDKSTATMVHQGAVNFVAEGAGGSVTITFNTPFEYNGGNLLIGCDNTTDADYKFIYFYGETVNGASISGYNASSLASVSATQRNFLPKTTFTYEPAATSSCPKPGSLAVSDIKAHSTELTWVEKGTATAWQICLNDDEGNLINASEASYSFSGLDPLTSYSVKVRANCGSEYSEWSAEKNFTTTSACPYEITIAPVATITTTTAEINVTEATGDAEAIEARYFHGNDTVVLDSEADEIDFKGEEGTISLENLEPATTYGIQVRAYCEDEGAYGDWSAVTNFTTKCEAVSAIDENFDGITAGSGVLPTCWSRINEASYYNYYPYVYNSSSSAHSGSNSLYFSTSNSSSYADEYAVLPELYNLNGKRIVFWAKQSGTATLQVGEMSDPADASTFIQTGSNVTLSSSYQKFTINLEGNGNYVAFKVVKPTSSYISVYIDDIKVEDVPSCLEPSGLSFVSATTTSAILNWNAGGSESAWDIYYSKENVAPTAETAPVLSGVTEKAISELEAASTYYVWVRAHCGDSEHSAWSEGISFQTECEAFALPFSKNFDDLAAGIPVCWDNSEGTTTDASYRWNYYATGYEGKCLRFNSYNNNNNLTNILATPVIHLSANSQMTFMCKNPAGGAFKVQIATAGSSDRTDLLTGLTGISSWTEKSVDLSAYTGQDVIIYFHATSNYGNGDAYIYLDNLSIEAIPTCYALKQISVSDISRRSMIVNLTPKTGHDLASAYELVYSTSVLDAAALEAAVKITINDTNAYEISGLERDTKYYLYVRANCGSEEGVSEWVSAEATTKGLNGCDDIQQIGEGTSTSATIPTHSNYDFTLSEQIYTPAEIGQAGQISSIAFYNNGTAKTRTIDVYMLHTSKSEFESNSDWVAVSESDKVYSGSFTFAAGAWNTIELNSQFTYNGEDNLMIVVDDNTDSYSSGLSCLTFSGAPNQTLYKYQDNNDIDPTNVTVTGTLSASKNQMLFSFCYNLDACPSVSDLSFELVGEGTSEAIVRWNIANADYLSGFDVIKSEAEITDFAGIEPTYANIQFDSIDLQGLNAATPYYIYVRAICKAENHDDGNSEWAGIHFTTNADCPLVQNLQAELTDLNKVKASWDLAFAEQEKHFQYILSETEMNEAALEAGSPVAIDDTTAFEIDGLDYDKEYHLYVASVCGAAHSDYQHASFSTLPSCQKVENLAAARVAHNLVELTWNSAQFASETQWKVGIVGDPGSAQIVSEPHAILFGLNTESAYEAYVIALCDGESLSDSVKFAFNTAAQPGACQQVGQGTSNGNMPVTNFDYAYTQMIYGANLIGQSGNITSLQLMRSSYTNVMNSMKVYLGTTDKATFASSSDWIAAEDLTLVYEGSFPAGTAENPNLELALSAPFAYNGSDNLVVAISNGHGNWNSIQNFYYTTASNTVLCRRADDTPSYAQHPGTAAGQDPSSNRTNIQFCFEPKSCPDVKALAISDITTSSAKASWEPMGSEMAWNVFISNAVVTDFSDLSAYEVVRVSELHKSFTGLLDDTDYFVYVQVADCEGADFVGTNFRTIAACLKQNAPAVVAESITAHTAIVKWVDPNAVKAGQYTIAYAKADKFDLENPLIATVQATDTFASLPALQADTVYKFAVKADCGETGASRWSDVAQFSTLESCFTPTSPVVVDESITAHSATVAWTDAHDDAGYIVAYGPYDAFDINDPATYATVNVTDTFAVLDGLNDATRYAFRVKGDCSSVGEGESKSWTYLKSFTTDCDAKALPFSEDFENSSALQCWTVGNKQSSSSTYIPYRSSEAKADGSYGLYMNAYVYSSTHADSAYAVLPELALGEDAITAYQISFNAKAYTSSYGSYYPHLHIGVADDDALTNLEIIADTTLSTDAFQEIEIPFAAYTGSGKRIVLLAHVDPSSTAYSRYGRIYVDNIYVSKASDCKRPNALAVSNITTDAAQLAWTENGEATAWQIRLNGDDEHLIDADANPFNLSALTAATAYSVEVRANCGGAQSDWSAPLNFATEICNEADKKAIRYEISDTYGDGWNGDAALKIVHKATNTEIASLTVKSADSKTPVIGNLPLCCGEEYSIIWVSGSFDSECRFALYDINDDVIVEHTTGSPTAGTLIDYTMNCVVPTCIKPDNLEAEVLSATSAQISWTAGGEETQFQYVCVLSGETPDWTGVEAVAATEAILDTLNIDTDYDFYVRAYCSETEQSDYRMTSFHVGYCVPAPTSVDAQGITAVAFNGTEISAAAHSTSAPYYANNAHIELDVHADESDSLQITFATGYTYGTVIWVDWNNNLTFEASEVVYMGTSDDTKPTTLNCVFQIPAATAEGIYRLRIGAADSFFDDYIDGSATEVDPCADGYYKLYEDYSIKVVSQGPGTGIDAIESKNAAIKRLENDQVVIIRDGKKYTIMGVKIQ